MYDYSLSLTVLLKQVDHQVKNFIPTTSAAVLQSLTLGRWPKQVSDSVEDCRTATDVVGVKNFNLMIHLFRKNSERQATIALLATLLRCNVDPGFPL